MRLVAVLAALAAACGSEGGGYDGFSAEEWEEIQEMSPLPATPPADTTNAHADDPAAAELGQALFFEKGYSGAIVVADDGQNGGLGQVGETGKVSCASCHEPAEAFDDQRSNPNNTSLAIAWGGRNTPTIINSAYLAWLGWDGHRDSLWSLFLDPPEEPSHMASDRLTIAHLLWDKYREEYDAAFDPDLDPALDPAAPDADRFPPSGKPKASPGDPDGAWEAMDPADQEIVNRIFSNFGKALEAYVRRLTSGNAPFDRWVAGDTTALTAAQKRGLHVFMGKAACYECHRGPALGGGKFHNLGVPQTGDHVPASDQGRLAAIPRLLGSPFNCNGPFSDDTATGRLDGLAATDADLASFRTSPLRNVALTPPYMHTGGFATLKDVVDFYNKGGGDEGTYQGTKDAKMVPLNLSAQEVDDLVAFLQALTGDAIPAPLLEDTSKP